ncbi:MAG: AAA family ATPase [Formosimonas sp.]
MLTKIKINDFKSYKQQELPISPLTLLIGANASGKTNALEAFRFLSWLSQGQKLSVLKHQLSESEQVLRGKLSDLGHLNAPIFTLGCETDDDEWSEYLVSIENRNHELHIVQEQIIGKTKSLPLYSIKQPAQGYSNDVQVEYNNFKQGGKKPMITGTDQFVLLSQLQTPAIFATNEKSKTTIPKMAKKFGNLLENTLFLDPIPSKMRGDSYPDKSALKGDCSNLAAVLYEFEHEKPILLEFIRSLPEQDISDLVFHKDNRGKVSFELNETFGEERRNWPSESLSDGTLRVLAIAAALLSAPEGATVVIEEVDNGIHPSRAKQLLKTMREQANRRNIRLVLSTHNPALMDAIPDESLKDVVFCYRDKKDGDSRLIRLSDLSDYPSLLAQGSLGDLVTQGIIDRFVKSPTSPEQKKQLALDWLNKMQGN